MIRADGGTGRINMMKEDKDTIGDDIVVKAAVAVVPDTFIEAAIHVVCGMRVMLDMDLARVYKVSTGQLNRGVQRHRGRFPQQFMFQLTRQQYDNLKCQIGISSMWGGRRKLAEHKELNGSAWRGFCTYGNFVCSKTN
jgi:hypothetical protein